MLWRPGPGRKTTLEAGVGGGRRWLSITLDLADKGEDPR